MAAAIVIVGFAPAIVAVTASAAPSAKQQAVAVSTVAMAKAKAGEYKLAAEMYHQAFKQDPSQLMYLYSAARAEHLGQDHAAAARDYERYLGLAPKNVPNREKTMTRLAEVKAKVEAERAQADAAILAKQHREAAAKQVAQEAALLKAKAEADAANAAKDQAMRELSARYPGAATAPPATKAPQPRQGPAWQGFFLSLNAGYATTGGLDGGYVDYSAIDPPKSAAGKPINGWQWALADDIESDDNYLNIVTTDRGAGPGLALQIGYSVLGYVSVWLDVSWHGSVTLDVLDLAGTVSVASMLGIQPLRFWRSDLPVDLRVYIGFAFLDVMYYHENRLQQLADDWVSGAKEPEPQARAWTGTAMPVGLDVRYRFSPESTFCMGLDLRFVQTWYTEWLVDQSRSLKANIEPPVATGRFEPRLVLAWHL